MPLGSMPLAVTSIGSSFHSGVGAAASFPGVQLIGLSCVVVVAVVVVVLPVCLKRLDQ